MQGPIAAALVREIETYVTDTFDEANTAYLDIVDNDNPNQTLKADMAEAGGRAENALQQYLQNTDRQAEQRRAASSSSTTKELLKLPKLQHGPMAAHGLAATAQRTEAQFFAAQGLSSGSSSEALSELWVEFMPSTTGPMRQVNVLKLQSLYAEASRKQGLSGGMAFKIGDSFCVKAAMGQPCQDEQGRTPFGHGHIHKVLKALQPSKAELAACTRCKGA